MGRRRTLDSKEVRGISLFEVQQDQIVAGRLYLEDVVHNDAGIEDAVQKLSGRRPQGAGQ